MPKEKVLIFENQKTQKFEIRFKKDYYYGPLNSFPLSTGITKAILLADEINNRHDHITQLIIGRMQKLKIDYKIKDDFFPVSTPVIPRIVHNKGDFDG